MADEAAFSSAGVYACKQLAAVPEANCVLGEVADSGFPQIDAYFAQAGTAPLMWNLPAGHAVGSLSVLQDRRLVIYRLAAMPAALSQTHPELTIIPARAGFKHVEQIAAEMRPQIPPQQAIEAQMCHLDDPHVDAVVGLRDKQAVAYGSVLSLGEAGLIMDLFVSTDCRRRGYGRTMAGHLLDICVRSVFKDVLWVLPEHDPRAEGFAERLGFVPVQTVLRREAV